MNMRLWKLVLPLLLWGGAASAQVLIQVPNAGTTGTTLNSLAKLTGAPSTAVITATTDTSGIVGIVTSGAGTTGNAWVARSGEATCNFDGATTAGDYVQNSSSTAGDCHDSGSTYPTTGQVLGRVLSTNGSAGAYPMTVDTGTVALTPTITDGTHTVTGTTQLTFSGCTVGGTSPNATATCSGGTSVVPGYRYRMILSNDGTSPNTTLDISTGVAADSTNAVMMTLSAQCQVVTSVSGAGGLDTGTIAASTWYAAFVINGTSGTNCIISKATAGTTPSPTLPSGYSYYRYVGEIYAAPSTAYITPFVQDGQFFNLATPTEDQAGVAVPTTWTTFTLNVPLGVKVLPISVAHLSVGTQYALFSSPDGNTSQAPSAAHFDLYGTSATTSLSNKYTNTSGQLYWIAGASGDTAYIWTNGWIDPN